jgi:DNA-binding XRE family transcriptional regulator
MKDLRTKLKLPQPIMAQLLDVGTPNLQAIEKGRRPLPKSQKANYQTLLSIANLPEWEKLEAQCTEEEELRNDFVAELAEELKQHQHTLEAARKRHLQLQKSYEKHTQIVKSLSAVEALFDDSGDQLFKKQVAFSKGKVKYAMRYKLLPGLFFIKQKIELANQRIEMINEVIGSSIKITQKE